MALKKLLGNGSPWVIGTLSQSTQAVQAQRGCVLDTAVSALSRRGRGGGGVAPREPVRYKFGDGDGGGQGRGEGRSDDGVGATESHPPGELLQQARDGAGGAGCRRLEPHGGAVGRQEHLPYRLQPHLALQRAGTPGGERGGEGGCGHIVFISY